jgi:hypothetical protein
MFKGPYMLLSRSPTVIVLALIAVSSTRTPHKTVTSETDGGKSGEGMLSQDARPGNCRVTLSSDGRFVPPSPVPAGPASHLEIASDQFWFGTEKLWTVLPADGTWPGSVPGKPGDFAYSNKLPWFRLHPAFSENDGPLTITGKRLDGPSPSFTEIFLSNAFSRDDDNAMIMGGIEIPAFGCWEITGQYKDQQLTFTAWVAPPLEQEMSSSTISAEPLARESPPSRIQVDGEVQARSLFYRVTPEIPPAAEAASISGTVVLHAVITTSGRTSELQYLSGPPLLSQAAIDAATWWQYGIAFANDQPDEPVEVDTTINVVFPEPHN